jgi:hypothetical protein
MLRAVLHSPAKRAYCGTGLVLAGLSPVYYTHLPFLSRYPGVICVLSFAALAFVFAFLQDWIDLTSGVKVELAWTFGAGSVLTMNGEAWFHNLIETWVPYAIWKQWLGLIDLVFPIMILLPVFVVFLGVLRYPRKWPERAYLLGGLCLVLLFIGEVWFNLFRIHFLGNPSLESNPARFVWVTVCLVAGTMGMVLGCLPQWSHRPSQLESAMPFCYLAGAVLLALGLFWDELAAVAPVPAMLGALAPASFMTWRWIASTVGARPH